jgi:anaerobic ribonucleoside-triphosphate reductase
MSHQRRLGARVLKAVASSLRLQVLTMLFDRGPMSYTEIMNTLHLNPGRDAGRFAYHLKSLMKADLVEPDPETKKYRLTDLGRMLVDVAGTIEEHSFKRRKMMVRTSRLAMEEFDRNKIAEALVKEASVPQELAQKIARETEARLLEVKAKYLTAPLIREFVNAILIERGLEEYRHKLTRLGLPVYDVTQLIKSPETKFTGVNLVHDSAGDSVIEEYTLLNVLPRDIADAHLSGSLHLSNLGVWVLKPNEFAHDMRPFLKHGLQFDGAQATFASSPSPKNFEAALSTLFNLVRITASEVSGEQLLDYFNVFLAPFAKGINADETRESLRRFVLNLNQTMLSIEAALSVSIGLELTVPNHLKDLDAIGVGGRKEGTYADYTEESKSLAQYFFEVMLEETRQRPLFQPSLIVKLRPEVFRNKETNTLLHSVHQLAAERGLPYFANLNTPEEACTSYMATGSRISADWKSDWELDTLRLGSIDSVLINLPRIAYESEGKSVKFYELLDEQLEMAMRAMEIKFQTIKLRNREGLLPFLANKFSGEQYAHFENCTRLISFVGLNEAIESFAGKPLYADQRSTEIAEQAVRHIYDGVRKNVRKPEGRPEAAMIPSPTATRRLAQSDIERYGWANVHVQGTKDAPFYTDLVAVPPEAKIPLQDRLRIEGEIHQFTPGGHLVALQPDDEKPDPAKLLSLSRQIALDSKICFYTFNCDYAYCIHCRKILLGHPVKCPTCGSSENLRFYQRVSAKYAALKP